jgi:carbonic anhydrase/acetyltransferase-like protein (isoleucine patch superfamily)
LRADGYDIRIGADCSFGLRATVHIVDDLISIPTVIGNRVTVGRFALAHACTVADDCIIGDEAVVMDGVKLGRGAVIGAGAFVSPRSDLAGGWLYEGMPAKAVRQIDQAELTMLHHALRSGEPNSLVCAADLSSLQKPGAANNTAPSRIDPESYVAPTAILAGNVQVNREASIWFGTAIIANDGAISIGERSNIQDNSLLETDLRRGPLAISHNVTIGHNVRMGACVIDHDCLIGMGSMLGDGTVVEAGACVAARALCTPGTTVESGYIWAGRPARKFRELRPEEINAFRRGRQVYVNYTHAYLANP